MNETNTDSDHAHDQGSTTNTVANNEGSTESTQTGQPSGTHEVEMRQFTAVSGYAFDDGYRFRLTKPLGLTGLTVDDLRGDTEAILYLSDPDTERRELTGALVVGEDLPGGRRDSRYRRIHNNRSSLAIYLKNEEIEALGVDVDGDTPPVLDVWASEDGMAFRPLDVREIVIEKELDHGLEALPDRMREDYLAVEEWGYTPAEWAEERGLTPMEEASGVFDPAAYVERNVKAAKRQLDADDSTD